MPQQANNTTQKQTIIIVTPQQWTHPLSGNAKDLAYEFSAIQNVIYINLPLDINTLLKRNFSKEDKLRIDALKGKKPRTEKINDNLWVYYPQMVLLSINFIPVHFIYALLNRINNLLFARSIKRALKDAGLNDSNIVLFNDNLMSKGLHLNNLLKPKLLIYYLRDNFENHAYFGKHGMADEQKIMQKANFVFTNSAYLAEKAKPYNQQSFDIGQGLRVPDKDPKLILNLEEWIKKPVVGYIGNITTMRLNKSLLERIAEAMPGYTFLFVGPYDADFAKSDLFNLPNVIFTGARPNEHIPHFMDYIDVAINPQVINQLTLGNYPRKVDEYLYYGKPVVATKTPFMSLFKDLVYLAQTEEEFVALLKKAIDENTPELEIARKAFAAEHSWKACVDKIYNLTGI